MKKIKYSDDNILGWTEQDFNEVQCDMINVRVKNNLPLTPAQIKLWCSGYGSEYMRKNLGINTIEIEKKTLQETIERMQERLKELNDNNKS